MITSNQLLHDFETATRSYIEVINSFSQEQLNTAPFAGSWTAAQVTDHLFKSDNYMLRALHGPVQPTHRPPDANVGNLRATFLDFSTKLQSPDFIIPDNIQHDKHYLVTAFTGVRNLLAKAITSLDLTATCPMPIFGEPTRLEIITFVIVHTQRHIHQVKHILELTQVEISNGR